jgi:hypothetical protein
METGLERGKRERAAAFLQFRRPQVKRLFSGEELSRLTIRGSQ